MRRQVAFFPTLCIGCGACAYVCPQEAILEEERLEAAVETCRALGVPCGVVVNRTGVGDRSVYIYCACEGLPILLEIPWQRAIAEAYARGGTLLNVDARWANTLCALYDEIVRVKERRR